ncbi:MFS transporter [Sneathiella sp.]|jgi:MFS family permease|uniref:MFS transporter n=1 Tax=Sneathiella sp. TaxID=1964365 RepID=UPI0039E30447
MTIRRAILFLAFGETLFWAGIYYIFPALIVRWETDFGWTKAELTGALTASIVSSALIAPFAGRLIDKGYGPHILAGGGFMGGVFLFSLSFIETLPAFYGIWIVLGICMGCCLYDPCFSFLIRTRGVEAKRAITLVTLIAGLAGTVSFPVSHLISDYAGWRVAATFFALLICVVGVPLMWFGGQYLNRHAVPQDQDGPTTEIPREGQYRFLLGPTFWLLAAGFTLLYMNHVAVINHLLLLLKERQFETSVAILAATFIGPMQVLGRLAMMFAERHVSNLIVTCLCFSFVILGNLALIGTSLSPAFLIAFIILQGSGIGVMSIMKPIITREILGAENFGLKAGAQSVPYMIGSAFAGLIASLIWAVGGYTLVLKVLICAPIVGLVLFLSASFLKAAKRG